MAREILQVDDVGSSFASRGQGRNPQRMHGDCRIKSKDGYVLANEFLNRPRCERSPSKSVESMATWCRNRPKQRRFGIFVDITQFDPKVESFDGFDVQGNDPLLTALPVDRQHAVFAARPETANAQGHQFADPTGGVGEYREHRTVSHTHGRCRIRCIEEPAAIAGRQADRLAIPGRGGGAHELAVCWVCTDVPVDLKVGEEVPVHDDCRALTERLQ